MLNASYDQEAGEAAQAHIPKQRKHDVENMTVVLPARKKNKSK